MDNDAWSNELNTEAKPVLGPNSMIPYVKIFVYIVLSHGLDLKRA